MLAKWPDKIWYPWVYTKVGGGFFIPTLTPDLFIHEVVESASYHGMAAEGYYGVHNGQYGLVVVRTR